MFHDNVSLQVVLAFGHVRAVLAPKGGIFAALEAHVRPQGLSVPVDFVTPGALVRTYKPNCKR